jgi:peptidoglycan hydrolase CwlO-like protein
MEEKPNENGPPKGSSVMDKIANNATTQVLGRVAMMACTLMVGLICWGGNLAISKSFDKLDEISHTQMTMQGDINSLRTSIATINISTINLNNRIDTSEKTLNSRIDSLSNWLRQFSDSLEKMKEIVYPLVGRRSN